VCSGLALEALDERCGQEVETGVAAPSQGQMRPAWPYTPRSGRTAAMAIAEDLDRATDSQWDWVAEHTLDCDEPDKFRQTVRSAT
jgi:hypothetical protein